VESDGGADIADDDDDDERGGGVATAPMLLCVKGSSDEVLVRGVRLLAATT